MKRILLLTKLPLIPFCSTVRTPLKPECFISVLQFGGSFVNTGRLVFISLDKLHMLRDGRLWDNMPQFCIRRVGQVLANTPMTHELYTIKEKSNFGETDCMKLSTKTELEETTQQSCVKTSGELTFMTFITFGLGGQSKA